MHCDVLLRTLTSYYLNQDQYHNIEALANVDLTHYSDVIMSVMAIQIIRLTIVNLTVCPAADQRKHQSSAALAFVRGIPQWPVNSPPKGQ